MKDKGVGKKRGWEKKGGGSESGWERKADGSEREGRGEEGKG